MTCPTKLDQDMLARIAALLLALSLLAERATGHAAARLRVVSILLPAHRAALTMLDVDLDLRCSERVPVLSHMDDRTCKSLLLQLSVSFRLIAAVLLHTCLNESRPSARALRHAIARPCPAPAGLASGRFLLGAGFVYDTS